MHRRIYHAVRGRDADAARGAMDGHLSLSEQAQVAEEGGPRSGAEKSSGDRNTTQ
jgi:DNA-binding FadR family transcriptional regulator